MDVIGNITNALTAYRAAQKSADGLQSAPLAAAMEMPVEKTRKPDFFGLVGEAVQRAMGRGYESEATQIKAMAKQADMHELVTAVAQAELTLQTVVTIRDKALGAYQDILKMPI